MAIVKNLMEIDMIIKKDLHSLIVKKRFVED